MPTPKKERKTITERKYVLAINITSDMDKPFDMLSVFWLYWYQYEILVQ